VVLFEQLTSLLSPPSKSTSSAYDIPFTPEQKQKGTSGPVAPPPRLPAAASDRKDSATSPFHQEPRAVLGRLAVNVMQSAATSPREASKKDRQEGPDDAEQEKAGRDKGPVQDNKDAHLRPLAVSFASWLICLFSSDVLRVFLVVKEDGDLVSLNIILSKACCIYLLFKVVR
jgi:hypothetical protein